MLEKICIMIDENVLKEFGRLANSTNREKNIEGLNRLIDLLQAEGYERIKYGNTSLSTLTGMRAAYQQIEDNRTFYRYLFKSFVERLYITFGYTTKYFTTIPYTKSCQSTGILEKHFPSIHCFVTYDQIFLIK